MRSDKKDEKINKKEINKLIKNRFITYKVLKTLFRAEDIKSSCRREDKLDSFLFVEKRK